VFIVVGAGSGTRQHLRHGQFAAMRWQRDDQRPSVDGDGLNSGAVVVLGTLVHEAAHALAHVRNINDTSRPGSLPHQALEKLDGALHIYRHRPRA
jgi:hypothetical protein